MWTGAKSLSRKSAPNDPWKLLLAVTWIGGTEPGFQLLESWRVGDRLVQLELYKRVRG